MSPASVIPAAEPKQGARRPAPVSVSMSENSCKCRTLRKSQIGKVKVMTPRKIVHRTRGSRHGQITRLMTPSDLGQVLKPFVFLDHFDLHGEAGGTELHPHSGIATVTYLFEGSIRYEDSNGATGAVPAGGVEWFKAAHGEWHAVGPGDTGRARGSQLAGAAVRAGARQCQHRGLGRRSPP